LQLARRAIDVLKTRRESDHSLSAFYRSWLIVATSFGLSIDFIPPPGTIPVSSDDGELLLLAGSVAEALATDPILRRDPSASRVAVLGSSGRDSSVQLFEAEQKYRAALKADVTLVEARVRLGSVLAAKGQLDAARRELERARQEAPPGPLAYLAALFLGRVHERAGRFQEASDSYQAAIREYPSSQTSYLALASVIEEQGETSRAWQTVRTMLQQREQEDPWWGYWYAQYWQINNRVMKLRAMVRQ
jgi:tetratricopeptide (TPR) repeat protein